MPSNLASAGLTTPSKGAAPLTVKFVPKGGKQSISTDPNKIEGDLLSDQRNAYGLSDTDWASRLPALAEARQIGMDQVEAPLQGHGDQYLQGVLNSAGFGKVPLGNTNEEISRSLGQPIAAKDQRDRSYFSNLIDANRPRPFGLNAKNVGDIALSNSGNRNRMAISGSQGASAAAQASVASQAQTGQALGGAIGSGLSTALSNILTPSQTTAGAYGGFTPGSAGADWNQAASQFGAGNVGYNSAGAAGSWGSDGSFTEASGTGGSSW